MKCSKFTLIARLLLAVLLLVFGFNKFFQYMPMPELQGSAAEVMMGFAKTGYIFPAVGIVEIIVGFLLLINRFSALALILLAPDVACSDLRLSFVETPDLARVAFKHGGEGGIRTHGSRERSTVFETAPFDHSGTSPV